MLYTAGATQRRGRVDDGTSTTDYDEEEIARRMSIATAAAVVEWGKTKINILDTPGFNMFVHEAKMVLPVVDAAIVVVDGVAGGEEGREKGGEGWGGGKKERGGVGWRVGRRRAHARARVGGVDD